jgi:hypothetical protein
MVDAGRLALRSAVLGAAVLVAFWTPVSEARWHGSCATAGIGPFGRQAVYPYPPFFYRDPPLSILDQGCMPAEPPMARPTPVPHGEPATHRSSDARQ